MYLKDEAQAQADAPKPVFDPFEACLGLRHRDIVHMLEILADPQAPKSNKCKALRILQEVIPGRQHEAETYDAVQIIRPFLNQPPNGLLMGAILCLRLLSATQMIARKLLPDVPRLAELMGAEGEKPLRREAATLLRVVAELCGPETPFLAGSVPQQLVAAVTFRESEPEFLKEAYGLLSRLANKQAVRVALIESVEALGVLVSSYKNVVVRSAALNLSANIAMDPSHRGKIALLGAGVLVNLSPFLDMEDARLRHSALSLLALLSVPKEGKIDVSDDDNLPEQVCRIKDNDTDEECRVAAAEVVRLVCEWPAARPIMGIQR